MTKGEYPLRLSKFCVFCAKEGGVKMNELNHNYSEVANGFMVNKRMEEHKNTNYGFRKSMGRNATYHVVNKSFPNFLSTMISDLFSVGYSAADISFLTKVDLDVVREISSGKIIKQMLPKHFFSILDLFSRVFGPWRNFDLDTVD